MKRQVLKVALLGANAVLMAAAVGMVCAFLASGIAWGVGWVDDWRGPARMFGGTIDGAEIVRFRRGCKHRRAELVIRIEMIDGYAELGMLPEWRHGTDPERPRAVSLDVERPTWWPGGANNRDSAVQAYGRDAVAKWGELVPAPSFDPIPFTPVDCLRCVM